ncbi:cell surface protein [Lachnospiraceae bacterium KM106-2]|nr:cell surface protein [Lachnospiraceae bacterium KM106-2]
MIQDVRKSLVSTLLYCVSLLLVLILTGFSSKAAVSDQNIFYYDGTNINNYSGQQEFVFTKDSTNENHLSQFNPFPKVLKVRYAEGCTAISEGELLAFPKVKTIELSKTVQTYIDEAKQDSIYFTDERWKQTSKFAEEDWIDIDDVRNPNYYCYNLTLLSNLENFIVDKDNPDFQAIDGILYNKAVTTLVKYPINHPNKSYTIPSTVTEEASIGSFYHTNHLEQLTIGAKTKLKLMDSSKRGDLAMWMGKLSKITVSSKNPYYKVIHNILYNKKGTVLYAIPIGRSTSKITALTFSDQLVNLNLELVPSYSLTTLSIPKSLKEFVVYNCYADGDSDSDIEYKRRVISPMDFLWKLKKVQVSSKNKYYSVYQNVLYNKKRTILYGICQSKRNIALKLPETLKTLSIYTGNLDHVKSLYIGRATKLTHLEDLAV